jgi:hypothetical protein
MSQVLMSRSEQVNLSQQIDQEILNLLTEADVPMDINEVLEVVAERVHRIPADVTSVLSSGIARKTYQSDFIKGWVFVDGADERNEQRQEALEQELVRQGGTADMRKLMKTVAKKVDSEQKLVSSLLLGVKQGKFSVNYMEARVSLVHSA